MALTDEQRAYHRAWYQKNKERIRNKLRPIRRAKMQYQRAVISRYKQMKGCTNCGERHPATLDLHNGHDLCVSTMISQEMAWVATKQTARDCIVLCSNCHRKLHWKEV